MSSGCVGGVTIAAKRSAARLGLALCGTFLAAAALPAAPARGGTFAEIGDAGQTPATAQSIDLLIGGGVGSLDQIQGTLPTASDSDVYRFSITTPALFSATVTTTDPAADTQIYLFTSDGIGIAFNDDNPYSGPTDYNGGLPMGDALYASLEPGIYLLGVSSYDNDPFIVPNPVDEPDYVFPFNADPLTIAISGPNASAVGVPFIDFDTVYGAPVGAYTIALTGSAVVPEPASLGLLGLAVAASQRRRRM